MHPQQSAHKACHLLPEDFPLPLPNFLSPVTGTPCHNISTPYCTKSYHILIMLKQHNSTRAQQLLRLATIWPQ